MSDDPPPEERKLRDRAMRNLLRAAQEAGRELSYPWVAKGDPDFNVFREEPADPKWEALLERLQPGTKQAEPRPSERATAKAAAPGPAPGVPVSQWIASEAKTAVAQTRSVEAAGPKAPRPIALPESPLGAGLGRPIGWTVAAVALALATLGVVWLVDGWLAEIAVAVALAVPTLGVAFLALNAWIESRPIAPEPADRARAD